MFKRARNLPDNTLFIDFGALSISDVFQISKPAYRSCSALAACENIWRNFDTGLAFGMGTKRTGDA